MQLDKNDHKMLRNLKFLMLLVVLGIITTLMFQAYSLKHEVLKVATTSSDEEVINKLKARFNDIGVVNIKLINESLFEVSIASKGEVFYTDRRGEYVIIGNLFDNASVNVTKKRVEEFKTEAFKPILKNIDKSKAVKVGNGSVEVLEFTDVDCSYCKTADSYFKDSNASRYIYFFPLDEIHPQAALKSIHILCAEDQALEYAKVMGGEVKEFKSCDKGEELLAIHRDYAQQLGVEGTPIFFIDGMKYVGANPKVQELVKHK